MKNLFSTLVALVLCHAVNAQCTAGLTYTIDPNNPMTLHVTNTSTYTPVPGSTPDFYVIWGDGPNSIEHIPYGVNTISHTYTTPYNYNIGIGMNYYDSLNNMAFICHDSTGVSVSIAPSPCYSTISKVSNGLGFYQFSATTLGNPTGVGYMWDFGDGNTGSGAVVNHTYTTPGSYTVTLTAASSTCTTSTTTTVQFSSTTLNCSQLQASISKSITGWDVQFNNTSTQASGGYIYRTSEWNFGDGSTSNLLHVSHSYLAPGTYTVSLITRWQDSLSNTIHCIDTAYTTVTLSVPPNIISGTIVADSSQMTAAANFKVWLIAHDSATNTLTAIDSTTTSGWGWSSYTFSSIAPGVYRVKAALLNGTPGTQNLIPTYHDSSLYWSSATLIFHNGGTTGSKDIYMKSGTYTSGPGFVGGNISQGANKGTSAGVANLLVLLRDQNGNLVKHTYTDGNGDYTFHGVPLGSYNVYPELMNWLTTPSAPVLVSGTSWHYNGINFTQTATEIKPGTASISNLPTANLFSIYPNPATDHVTLNWKTKGGVADVQVIDVTGRIVLKENMDMNDRKVLDISKLQSGTYFIRVLSDDSRDMQRLVIQR